MTDLDLDEHELALLRAACRTADNLERLAAVLEHASTTTENARGDQVANPVYVEHGTRPSPSQRRSPVSVCRRASPTVASWPARSVVEPRGAYGIRGSVD